MFQSIFHYTIYTTILSMNLSRVEGILVVLTHSKFQFTILQVFRFHVLLKVRYSLQDSSRHEGNKFVQITLVCLNIRGSNQKINISCPKYFRNGKCLYQKRRISASTLESLGRRLVSLSFCKNVYSYHVSSITLLTRILFSKDV